MEATVYEKDDGFMTTDEVAALLVKLYASYARDNGQYDDYAKAVGIAIRMLSD